ncbi:hypothetical protein O5282_26895 [Escherichia coli]|nr:hypothetical protein [Escherichia coli]
MHTYTESGHHCHRGPVLVAAVKAHVLARIEEVSEQGTGNSVIVDAAADVWTMERRGEWR